MVTFNYSLEKVVQFTRIPLPSITSIQKGAYILSTLQEASRDPKEVSCTLLMITANILRMPVSSSTSHPPTSLPATVHTPFATRLLPQLQLRSQSQRPLHPQHPHLLSNMPSSTLMLLNITHSRLFQDSQVMRLARRL